MQYCLVYITTENNEEARRIGKVLVEEKLAACVNIHPIESVYRWKGNIEEDIEAAMLAKTRAGLVDEVIKRVKELHSYEVPCIISISIEKGNHDYFKWIEESTR